MASPKDYYRLAKPGIVYGNAIHFVAGALLAASVLWSWLAVFGGLIGSVLIVASACVVNNYIDRDIDQKMKRTLERPSVTGAVPPAAGLVYAGSLATVGFSVLVLTTNALTVLLGVVAYVMYAFVYTLCKRRTVHHTLIGTIPGALPVVAGYTALTNEIDTAAYALFFLVVVWQLGHFYAIGVYRKEEYRLARVPMLTERLSSDAVRSLIVGSILLYIITASLLSYAILSWGTGILLIAAGLWWLVGALDSRKPTKEWGRDAFRRSLVLSVLLPLIMLVELIVIRFF